MRLDGDDLSFACTHRRGLVRRSCLVVMRCGEAEVVVVTGRCPNTRTPPTLFGGWLEKFWGWIGTPPSLTPPLTGGGCGCGWARGGFKLDGSGKGKNVSLTQLNLV